MNPTLRQLITDHPDATDAQLLALCAADRRTARPLSLADLRPVLALTGVLGKLHRAALADDDAANAYAYVATGERIRSDQPAEAAKLDELLSKLAAANIVTPEVTAAAVAMAGGYVLAAVTAEDLAAERVGIARDAALSTLSLAHAALANDRAGKLAWLALHPDTEVPANLDALDAFSIPVEGA